MCYSVESSLRTTLMSLAAIVYLLSSQIPHFQWLAITLSGWCLMQFAEMLLWLTNPGPATAPAAAPAVATAAGCNNYNTLITLTLIPLALVLQPLGSVIGSLYVIPWAKSSDARKSFMVVFSALAIAFVAKAQYYKPHTLCAVVTPGGHLYWNTSDFALSKGATSKINSFIWALIIVLPLFIFWDKSLFLILMLIIIPFLGLLYGTLRTDALGSIWCYYTSYSSVIMAGFLFLRQAGIYNVLG